MGRGGSHLRFDVWAMKRAYASPAMYGYEVKVSRGDFLRDDKWRAYLPFCNQFSFACPWGLISVDELPPDVGLFYASKTGSRLFTKRKPVYRPAEPDVALLMYILMSRARIAGETRYDEGTREYWQSWLEKRELDTEFGHRVSKAIAETVREKVTLVEVENRRLRAENDGLADVREMVKELGVDGGAYSGLRRAVERRVAELTSLGVDVALAAFRHTRRQLDVLEEALSELAAYDENARRGDG